MRSAAWIMLALSQAISSAFGASPYSSSQEVDIAAAAWYGEPTPCDCSSNHPHRTSTSTSAKITQTQKGLDELSPSEWKQVINIVESAAEQILAKPSSSHQSTRSRSASSVSASCTPGASRKTASGLIFGTGTAGWANSTAVDAAPRPTSTSILVVRPSGGVSGTGAPVTSTSRGPLPTNAAKSEKYGSDQEALWHLLGLGAAFALL